MENTPEGLPPGIKRSPTGRVPKWVIDEAMGIPAPPPSQPEPAPEQKKSWVPKSTSEDSPYEDESHGLSWGRYQEPERVYTLKRSVRVTLAVCIFAVPTFIVVLTHFG